MNAAIVLAEPALRDDGEACRGDQRGQEQEDGGDREHRQRLCLLLLRLILGPRERGRFPLAGVGCTVHVGVDRGAARVDENRDGVERPRRRGGDESELVAQLARILDDPDHGPAMAVQCERRPELEPEELRHPVGDGDLSLPVRIATLTDREKLAGEDTVRFLCTVVEALDAARDGH
jgi:hypothetical protein